MFKPCGRCDSSGVLMAKHRATGKIVALFCFCRWASGHRTWAIPQFNKRIDEDFEVTPAPRDWFKIEALIDRYRESVEFWKSTGTLYENRKRCWTDNY